MNLRYLTYVCALALFLSTHVIAQEKTEWSSFLGPDGNGVLEDGKPFKGTKPQLVWKSKEQMPSGRVRDGRRDGSDESKTSGHAGGYSSPVYADGKIYMFTYRPNGDIFDGHCLKRMGLTNEQALKLAKEKDPKGNSPIVSEPNKWAIEADDIIICLDAKTGKTLWKKVYEREGINWNMFSKGGPFNTPAVYDGKVYAVGTTGNVYCLDAKTGKEIWKGDIGPRAKFQQQHKATALKSGFCTRFNRDFLSNVVVADGVVVLSDCAKHKILEKGNRKGWVYNYEPNNGVIGLDAKTGKKLWHHPNHGSGLQPAIWRHGGKTYAIGDGRQKLQCIEVKTGKIMWSIEPGHRGRVFTPVASGEYMLIVPHIEGNKHAEPVACYKINPSGAKKIWQLNKEQAGVSGNLLIYKEHAYIALKNQKKIVCLELETGKEVASAELPQLNGEHDNAMLIVYNGRMMFCTGRDTRKLVTIDADPKNFGKNPASFSIPITIGYMLPILPAFNNGVMYVRSDDAISAYRLR